MNPDTESDRGFDVFINFRGPDSRYTVTDVLYNSLTRAGFRVFLDDEEIRKGEVIEGELLRAITNSKIYVAILSKDYASSKWCLRELAKMIDCWEASSSSTKKVMLPIFCNVDVSEDVKLRSHVYTTALQKHENELGEAAVKPWRDALQKVAKIKGWDLKNHGLSELADLITKEVFSKLTACRAVPGVPDRLVGIDKPIEDIMKLLELGSPGVRFIVIHGMGGIGKTTLANAVFKKISSCFRGSCFLKDVRRSSSDHDMVTLQEKLLLDTLNLKFIEVVDVDGGKDLISERLRDQNVLIVLDDVDKPDHLLNLAAKSFWFNPKSRIIITTRNTDFLPTKDDKYYFYEMKEMDHGLALQLFCQHAFEKDRPPPEFYHISIEIVATTGRLPLSLQVIGSSLYNQDKETWKFKLEKLKEAPHKDVQKTLMISYEALEYEQQQIFLDVACLFNGEKSMDPIYFWEACKLHPEWSIKILKQRSLIKVYDDGTLSMHDQLRDLGRAIAQPSRPSSPKYALNALQRKEVDKSITALKLGKLDADYYFASAEFARADNLRFLELQGGNLKGDFRNVFHQLRWLSWFECPLRFKATNLSFKNLVVLKLSSSQLVEDRSGWSVFMEAKQLKVLHLKDYKHLKKTPNFSAFLELKRLTIRDCKEIEEIDGSIDKLEDLNYLEISNHNSINVQEGWKMPTLPHLLPDSIGCLKSLMELKIENVGLSKLHPSIGQLVNLKLLRLRCPQLKILPNSIGLLELLVELDLAMSGMKELPNSIGHLKRLKILRMNGSAIEYMPNTIGKLESLEELDLSNTKKITRLPETIGNLIRLKVINLSFCGIMVLPKNLIKLENLQILDASYCWRMNGEIPQEIGKLSRLSILKLTRSNVGRVPRTTNQLSHPYEPTLQGIWEPEQSSKLPTSLTRSDAIPPPMMSDSVPDLSNMTNLTSLHLSWWESSAREWYLPSSCNQTPHVKWLARLTKLEDLTLELPDLKSPPTELGSLSRLQSLAVTCFEPQSLTHIPSSLQSLTLFHVRSLTGLHLLSSLKNITTLTLSQCGLEEIKLYGLEQLHVLELSDCRVLERLSNLSTLKELRELDINFCEHLVDIEGLGKLGSLRSLNLSHCDSLARMEGLGELKSLRSLMLNACRSVLRLRDLSKLKNLEYLKITSCDNLQGIPDVAKEAPCYLHVGDCRHFPNFRGPYSEKPERYLTRTNHCKSLHGRSGVGSLFKLLKDPRN